MESLKIAIASDWFYPKVGGIETHIDELASRLVQLGHEVHVFTHDYRHYPWSREEPQRDYTIHRLRGSVYMKCCHVSLGPGALRQANSIYKAIRFDITHVHSIYSPFSIGFANLSRGIRGIPVVATNHSLFSWHSAAARVALPLLRMHLRRIDSFIAVSSVVAEDTRRVLGKRLRLRPVYVVPNAIDPSFWRPPEPRERERARKALGLGPEPVVLVVGRLTRRKAVDRAPAIVHRAAKLLGKRLQLLIVGDGPARGTVEDAIRRHSNGLLTARVIGFVERSQLREIYWAGDVLLLTSRLEAFSITALEAMASGVPVIGYHSSGVRDILAGGGGLLVSDEESAAEALAGLLSDTDALAKLRRNAVTRIQEGFTWDTVLPRILDVYRKTIEYATLEDREYLLHKLWLRISKLAP